MTRQTRLHRHWYVRIKSECVVRWLRKPRWNTYNPVKAEQSRFVWGPCRHHPYPTGFECYSLSLLGVLHALTGVVLEWEDEPDDRR